MTWAPRLKSDFNIDIEIYLTCGASVRIIACIEEAAVITRILDHLKSKNETRKSVPMPENGAPLGALFG